MTADDMIYLHTVNIGGAQNSVEQTLLDFTSQGHFLSKTVETLLLNTPLENVKYFENRRDICPLSAF